MDGGTIRELLEKSTRNKDSMATGRFLKGDALDLSLTQFYDRLFEGANEAVEKQLTYMIEDDQLKGEDLYTDNSDKLTKAINDSSRQFFLERQFMDNENKNDAQAAGNNEQAKEDLDDEINNEEDAEFA